MVGIKELFIVFILLKTAEEEPGGCLTVEEAKCHTFGTICYEHRKKIWNCTGENTYHCAWDPGRLQFVDTCAKKKLCREGEEPWLYFKEYNGVTAYIKCEYCREFEKYYNPHAQWSNEYSACEEKKDICDPKEHKIVCNLLDEYDKYSKNRRCRCDVKKGYRINKQYPSTKHACTDEKFWGCMVANCDEDEDVLLMGYECVSKCPLGYSRSDENSDNCIAIPTSPQPPITQVSVSSQSTKPSTTTTTTKTYLQKLSTPSSTSETKTTTNYEVTTIKAPEDMKNILIRILIICSSVFGVVLIVGITSYCLYRKTDRYRRSFVEERGSARMRKKQLYNIKAKDCGTVIVNINEQQPSDQLLQDQNEDEDSSENDNENSQLHTHDVNGSGDGQKQRSRTPSGSEDDSLSLPSRTNSYILEHSEIADECLKKEMLEDALDKSLKKLVADMDPNPILDGLIHELGYVRMKSIRDLGITYDMNVKIYEFIRGGSWQRYVTFKKCLQKEGLKPCIETLQRFEQEFIKSRKDRPETDNDDAKGSEVTMKTVSKHLQDLSQSSDFELFLELAASIEKPDLPSPRNSMIQDKNKMSYENCPDGYQPYKSSGNDNSCLYQSISLLLAGDEHLQRDLRLLATLCSAEKWKEIVQEFTRRLQDVSHDDVLQFFMSMVNDTSPPSEEDRQMPKDELIQKYIKRFIMETPKPGKDSCQLHVYFLSQALQRSIKAYSQRSSDEMIDTTIEGDEEEPLCIMWVNSANNPDGEPNHIVPLVKIESGNNIDEEIESGNNTDEEIESGSNTDEEIESGNNTDKELVPLL